MGKNTKPSKTAAPATPDEVKKPDAPADTTADAPKEPEAKVKAKDVKLITFTLKNGYVRTFSEDEHGEEFKALADEFEATNKHQVAHRKHA